MHYGIFLIATDDDGNEHVGAMVHNCDRWTAACNFIRAAYATGEFHGATDVPDGTPIPDEPNCLKALELEARPWGTNPPRIKPGQIV